MDSIYGTNLNEIERTRCRLNVTSHLIDEGGLPYMYIGHGVGIVGTVLDSRHIDTTSERRAGVSSFQKYQIHVCVYSVTLAIRSSGVCRVPSDDSCVD